MRFGSVAIVGRTNVGKSTFLNAVLGQRLAITSPVPQTTRDLLLGVAQREDAQIAFVDTPGLHAPRHELGRRMNAAALEALRTHDLVLFMTDVGHLPKRPPLHGSDADLVHSADRRLLSELPRGTTAVAVVNKVDLLRDKARLLPYLKALSEVYPFEALVPTSVLKLSGVEAVVAELTARLPEGPPGYDPELLTDRPLTFFVREYVREQVMLQCYAELPHAVAVTVDRFDEGERLTRVEATIHTEKVGQRGVLIGKGGERIKAVGTAARLRLEELLGRRVHLTLFVRVTERWKDVPRQLNELGYSIAETGEVAVRGGREVEPGQADAPADAGSLQPDASQDGSPAEHVDAREQEPGQVGSPVERATEAEGEP
ncbi:MAG: GTPase Era [Polyangiaceae bacterium]|nr:GTPase Era [Polyangiaceae bacterium]MCW5790801.1 GTPase Era [Polyangiaceae bacterium]